MQPDRSPEHGEMISADRGDSFWDVEYQERGADEVMLRPPALYGRRSAMNQFASESSSSGSCTSWPAGPTTHSLDAESPTRSVPKATPSRRSLSTVTSLHCGTSWASSTTLCNPCHTWATASRPRQVPRGHCAGTPSQDERPEDANKSPENVTRPKRGQSGYVDADWRQS